MTNPDAHNQLREAMAEALDGDWGDERFEIAATLLPVVTAYAKRQARERAAEELRAAAEEMIDGVDRWLLSEHADALNPERNKA